MHATLTERVPINRPGSECSYVSVGKSSRKPEHVNTSCKNQTVPAEMPAYSTGNVVGEVPLGKVDTGRIKIREGILGPVDRRIVGSLYRFSA